MTNETLKSRSVNLDAATYYNAMNKGNQSKAAQIIGFFKEGYDEKDVESFMEKKSISESDVVAVIDKLENISQRTLHKFDSLDEMNEFQKNNKCGEQWLDNNNQLCVYKY